jgi:hypothetical protein
LLLRAHRRSGKRGENRDQAETLHVLSSFHGIPGRERRNPSGKG